MRWVGKRARGATLFLALYTIGIAAQLQFGARPQSDAQSLASLFCGLLGLWWSYRIARYVAAATFATLGTVVIGGGTFVLWYLIREPSMSHSVSIASVAAFTLAWLNYRSSDSWRTWTLLGLLGAVMVIMRWQNAIVLLVPAASLWRTPRSAAAFASGVFIGTLPGLWAWDALYGAWITPAASPRTLWTKVEWLDVLWSSRSGLFATSPAAYAGVIGLAVLWRRHRPLALMGVITLVLMTWTNGAVEDWWAGYGGQRFDSLIPFLVCGVAVLATMMTEAIRRRPAMTAAALLAGLVVWNLTLVAAARAGAYGIGEIVSFGDVAAAQAAVVHSWIGHPASFPANVIWATANGVTPDRFDRLRPNRFLSDPDRPFGLVDIGSADTDPDFIGTGWHGAERAGDLTFRWVDAQAGLLIPLARADSLWVQIQARPFDSAGLPPQVLTLQVNGRAFAAVPMESGWRRVDIPTGNEVWHAGINHLTLNFSRATRPSDLGGGDGRRLAAAIDYVRIQKR